jgi:serine/threonine-protein phosphatase 4 regulatory subunit 1
LDQRILPLLNYLSKSQNFQVLDALLSGLPHFGENLFDYFPDIAESVLVNTIFPLLDEVATNVTEDLITAVSECIAALITILDPEDVPTTAFPMLEKFLHSSKAEARTVTAEILTLLVDFLNPEVYAHSITRLFERLGSDLDSIVRNLVPPLISDYSRQFENPRDKVQLSAMFSLLVLDHSTPVRVACAESLLKLAEGLDARSRIVTVMPALRQFLEDSQECVRRIAHKNLGALMAQFGPAVDPALIAKYCSLLAAGDTEMAFAAAFSFPAVALALGKPRWPEIKPAFEVAVGSQNFQVRRSLAFGLVSFGPMMEQAELRAILLDFMNDISEVAVGALTNLYQIVQYIEDKFEVLSCLVGLLRKNANWRMRLRISEQLRYCSEEFDHSLLRESAKLLLHDKVAAVRNDAILSFVCLMVPDELPYVATMAASAYFVDREVVAAMIGYFPDNVLPQAVPLLIELCADKVPNVRLSAARSLRSLGDRVPDLRTEIAAACERLRCDPDMDVREFVD